MRNLYLWLCGMLISFSALAQFTVEGTVIDSASNSTVPGVNILEAGTSNGTTSDQSGRFSLAVASESAMLEFSFIGYDVKRIPAKQASIANVSLIQSSTTLNEVIVTALGIERQSRDLGYALQRIEAKEISEVKSTNFVDNLAGRAAGVTVTQGATGVGSSSRITIRGEASFTNNNPLFVVDGIPINNNSNVNFTNDAAAGFQEVDFGNGGMEINPDDVASVTVLKGPAAAALYGTRASNGVIIIETKDGSRLNGTQVSINSSTYLEQPFQLPKFQNTYGQGNSGQFEFVDGLGGGTNDNITYSYGPRLDAGLNVAQFDSPVALSDGTTVRGGDVSAHGGTPITPSPFISNPDNLKDFYELGVTTINNVSVATGFNKGSYRISFTDLRSDSYIPGVNLKRNTASARMTFRPTSKWKISSALNYVNSRSDNRPSSGYGSENINYSLVAWGPRSMNTASLEDYWQPGFEGLEQYSFNYTFFDNPYFILLENRNSFNRDRMYGNIAARYEITEQWSVQVRSGMDYSSELRQFRRAYSTNRFQSGAYAEHTVRYRENNTDILLNYREIFGDFTVDVSAGANRMDQLASTQQTQALTLAQPGIYSLANAASPLETFQFESQKRINSLYALVKLGYKDFLFVDITGRNDWSSALATPTSAENTGFFYPSFSGSFVLSNVVDLPRSISFAKVRASFAQVGNDTDPYQTAGVFQSQTPVSGNPTLSDQATIANGNLLPEQTSAMEVGADIRFFRDRLSLDATYYNSATKNQIIALPVPISSGYDQQVVNGGLVRSQGAEIVLGLTPVKRKNFEWKSFVNFSRNVTTVEELPEGVETLTLAYSRVYDNVNQTVWLQVQEGGRIGDLYGTGYQKNSDGRFVLDDNGNYIANNDLIKLGNYNPDFIIGWANQFSWKKFSGSILLDWRQGGVLVSRTQALAGVAGQLEETEDRPEAGIVADGVVNVGTAANPVYEENTQAITAESYYRQFYDRNHEENNTYDASYLKVREVSVSYTFSGPGTSEGWLKDDRTFVVSIIGRNLYAFSAIPHFDPEQQAVQGSQFISGVEDMSYPTARSIGVKLNLTF